MDSLEFRAFLSSFALVLVMHDDGQGFHISCTFQSKFPQQLTWGLQHLGFCALCKCRTRSSPAGTASVCFRILCRWRAVLKHPSVLWVSSRQKSPWNSNLLEKPTLLGVWVFFITSLWRLGQTGTFCIRCGWVHRNLKHNLQLGSLRPF